MLQAVKWRRVSGGTPQGGWRGSGEAETRSWQYCGGMLTNHDRLVQRKIETTKTEDLTPAALLETHPHACARCVLTCAAMSTSWGSFRYLPSPSFRKSSKLPAESPEHSIRLTAVVQTQRRASQWRRASSSGGWQGGCASRLFCLSQSFD